MSEQFSVLKRYPTYEVVMGMEVHVQLTTKSKIFCSCNNGPCEVPNSQIDPICSGHPGVLPVLNKEVLKSAIMAGLGTNCTVNKKSIFSRKHYFYPDLPKGYQITQGDMPICSEGHVVVKDLDGNDKKIRILRIHIEEDAGKNTHTAESDVSFVDLNRAGTPLLEIVSYPDLSSAHEVRGYLKELHAIVTTLGICSGNMEDGAFRADTNISIRKKGDTHLNTKCELKNINSFKFICDAIEYEIERQIGIMESGEKVRQQTRLWDSKNKCTFVMREKEDAADYRYFDDPDMPHIQLTDKQIEEVKLSMPELPAVKRSRLALVYGLSDYEVTVLTDDISYAHYFEQAYALQKSPHIIKWVLREIARFCKDSKISPLQLSFTPAHLAQLVSFLDQSKITAKIAQDVFQSCVVTGEYPKEYIEKNDLICVGYSESDLQKMIDTLIFENPKTVADYKSGKDKLFGFFVGKMMALTKGGADPVLINSLLKKSLQ